MSQSSSNNDSSVIRPTLHHFGVTTRHLERMLDWYAKVVGMVTIYSISNTRGSAAGMPDGIAFVSNDKANHRLAIFSLPELKDDTTKAHVKLQHVAFEYATIDDLLNSYVRIKKLGIEQVLAMDHGISIALYYKDPDGNTVELFVDSLGNWDKSREYMQSMQSSPDFHKKPLGTFVDVDKLVAARQAGMSIYYNSSPSIPTTPEIVQGLSTRD